MSRPITQSFANPSSYDPLSPSYDTGVASPCNPFPTTSPFLPVVYKQSQNAIDSLAQSVSVTQQQQQLQSATTLLSRLPPPHSAPSLRRTKPCRFYLYMNGCKAGRWCNFKHPAGAHKEHGSPPSTLPTEFWDGVPDVRELDPDWGRESDGDFHPKYRTQPCKNFLLGLCRFGDKCQFIHPPSVFSVPSINPPPAKFTNSFTVSLFVPESREVKVSSERSVRKTIPCINFEMDGECSHGSDCRFIHKPRATAIRFRVEVKKDNSGDSQNKRKEGAPRKGNVRPPKAIKAGAIKKAEGIQKPTWRVVGSGIRLADMVKRESFVDAIANDASYQSPEMTSQSSTFESQSPTTFTSSPSRSSMSLPSPDDVLLLDPSTADLSQYDFATPTYFPTGEHNYFRAPSPDVPLDITMGGHEFYDLPQTSAHRGQGKRAPMTGSDLIRQMREGDPLYYRETQGLKRCRSKPQLTIYVPPLRRSTSSVDIKRGVPGQTPFPCATEHSVNPDTLEPVTELGGYSDHESRSNEEFEEEGEEEEQVEDVVSTGNDALYIVEEIRRPHSTPPTPWSSNHLVEVPLLPRLPAESP